VSVIRLLNVLFQRFNCCIRFRRKNWNNWETVELEDCDSKCIQTRICDVISESQAYGGAKRVLISRRA